MKFVLFKLVLQNWRTKLLALMLAITVWIYLNTIIYKKTTLNIPLRLQDSTPSLIAILSSNKATFNLEGPGNIIHDFAVSPTVGNYSISNISMLPEEKIKKLQIPTQKFLQIPLDIHIYKPVVPETTTITLFRSEIRLLKIFPQIKYEISGENKHVEITTSPSLILAKIPCVVSSEENSVYTEPIHLGKIASPGKFDIPVRLESQIGEYPIEYLTKLQEVVVHIIVTQNTVRRVPLRLRIVTEQGIPIPALRLASYLDPNIEILGPPHLVEKYSQVFVYIDFSNWPGESQLFPLQFVLPEEIKILTPLPSHVKIETKN